MIRDRGNIKWVSLMLPEHVDQLRKVMTDSKKIQKPIIDEQTYAEFDELISNAVKNKKKLIISYYKNGSINKLTGTINKFDMLNKSLEIIKNDAKIYCINFADIIALDINN